MPHLLIRHKVSDFAQWKRAYDQHAPARGAAGLKELHVLRNVDDTTEVIILFAADDLAKAKAFVASDDLHTAMQKAGVADKPDLYFLS